MRRRIRSGILDAQDVASPSARRARGRHRPSSVPPQQEPAMRASSRCLALAVAIILSAAPTAAAQQPAVDAAPRTVAVYRFDGWRAPGLPAEVVVADSA